MVAAGRPPIESSPAPACLININQLESIFSNLITLGPVTRRADMDQAWKAGLEDVIAARSAVCQVDGEGGRLYYRGYEIGDLARAVSFEDVTALLWFGELPSTAEAVAFAVRLRAA